MHPKISISLATIVVLIIFPLLVVQAQSDEASEVLAATSSEGSVNQEVVSDPETAPAQQEALGEVSNQQGEVLGAEDAVAPQDAAPPTVELVSIDVASSTPEGEIATSTPPIEEPKPIEEPFVLQPAVELVVNGNSISAAIELQNLTCKVCDKVLPDLDVAVYYTPWYPNDGDSHEGKERTAPQTMKAPSLKNWEKGSVTWSAEEVAPGKYYFVVEIDPENAYGAYRLFRSEFVI